MTKIFKVLFLFSEAFFFSRKLFHFITYYNNFASSDIWLCVKHGTLLLWEESRLRLLVNRIPRRIFGSKRDENEELHSLYRSPNIIRLIKSIRQRWAWHVTRMEEGRNAFKILTDKSTGKRPLERPRRRQEDNIRMDLEEIGINAGNWVDSAEDRVYRRALVNGAFNPWVP